jgi:putative transposase
LKAVILRVLQFCIIFLLLSPSLLHAFEGKVVCISDGDTIKVLKDGQQVKIRLAAIETIFPATEVQLCVVHQIRNSLRYVGSKNQKEFMVDLKRVYKASNKGLAESELDKLEDKWNDKYPIVIKSWRNNWERLSQYFKYPEDIRRIIYTTNTIEAVHRQFRKLTKTKGAFPNKDSLLKLLYMGIQNASKKWTMPIQNWSLTISQLAIFFEGKLDKELRL